MTTFFIGGAPRSGGTLLTSILCADGTTNPILREAHFLREMVQVYRHGKRSFESLEDRHYFSNQQELRDFSSLWVTAFLDRLLISHTPASNLVLKSFLLSIMFPAVHELIPDARFLISVRDPRDIITSQVEVGQRQVLQGQPNRFPRDIIALSKENRQYYMPSVANIDPIFRSKVLYVRYEDLTQDIESQLKRIREFTGLSLSGYAPKSDWTNNGRDFKSEHKAGDPYINELYGKGISSSRVQRYLNVLTPAEIATVETECAPLFQEFGYQTGEQA